MEKDTISETGSTSIFFGSEARQLLLRGVTTAAAAVGATMGPRGKTVLISREGGQPTLTKDGVTVSKSVRPKDPVERMGAELVLEAASRTNDIAGDGTTTSTVLTESLIKEGCRLLEAGYSAKKLIEGVDVAVKRVTQSLVEQSTPVTKRAQIEHVGTISANGDTAVGKVIADAMELVGADGIVTIEDAKGMVTTLDHVEGMQFERGYVSPYFVTNNDRMNVVFADCKVLVTDRKISLMKDIIPLLEDVNKSRQPLLIIADEIEGEALQGLILNKVKADLRIVAVKAPGYGKTRDLFLQDICVLTDAQLVSPSNGLSLDKARLKELGSAKKIVVDSKSTTIVGAGLTAANVATHVETLKEQLQDITLDATDSSLLRSRIARLSSGVAIIKVGGSTEVEMLERKYRIEDALHATRAAAEEGIVAGGGSALAKASLLLKDSEIDDHEVKAGVDIVARACLGPIKKIVSNASGSPDVVIQKIFEGQLDDPWWGYNAASGEYQNLLTAGIIDPVKVTRLALENARSIATSFISIDAVIVENKNST